MDGCVFASETNNIDFIYHLYHVVTPSSQPILLQCLMMYYNVFVFAVFLVSLHGDSCKCTV